jgi:hypothetical protein
MYVCMYIFPFTISYKQLLLQMKEGKCTKNLHP